MRTTKSRAAIAALSLLAAALGCTFVACSGGEGNTGDAGAADATEASPFLDSGGPDAGDATTSDGPPHADADARSPDADAATVGDADAASEADATLVDGDAASADAFAGDADAAADSAAVDADADAGTPVDAGCTYGVVGEAIELRCAHLYSDWASKTVYADVLPYDPGLHFWSDGAVKTRWINLPPGQKIDTSDMNEWTLPVGTQIWKEFALPLGDASTPTRIETRLLWKQDATHWWRTTYRWSADGTSSATELLTGELDAGGTGYEVPTQSGCNECHNGRKDGVLGFEAVSLSSPGASGVTMQALVAQGLLTAPPAAPITIPGNATESTALGWLHANCGTACHNGGNGEASFTGFWVRLDVGTLASVQTTAAYTTGWNQLSGYQLPDASTSYRIHACDTGSSCAYYRPSHRTGVNGTPPGVQMPPIDTHKVDDAAMAQVAAWINQGCSAGDAGAD